MREQGQDKAAPVIAPTPRAATSSGLEGLSYAQLKARLNELQQQRQTIASRREAIAGQYERASGANQKGIGDRLTVMDNSIVGMETNIAAIALEMSKKAPVQTQPPFVPNGYWQDDVAGLGFSVFFGTLLLSVLVMRRFGWRRWARTQSVPATDTPLSNQRLDRIEHAVDAIAIEIERVSENQRFMTRLMTETQLAGTIAAVRNSAEAAKDQVAG